MTNKPLRPNKDENIGKLISKGKGKRILAVQSQLSSPLPSDVWRGFEQINQWLSENPEDKEIYTMLLDAVKENPSIQERVYDLLEFMIIDKHSKTAVDIKHSLPPNILDLIAEADDAYYAGEYKTSIQIYRRVLNLDSNNEHCSQQLQKAILKLEENPTTVNLNHHLFREAIQWYKRARSYISANDIRSAITFLNAAVEEARSKDIIFHEAEELLNKLQNKLDKDNGITESYKYDVFISYSHKNEDWVRSNLLGFIESNKITACIDYRDFEPGAPSLTEMERAVQESNKTILILSPEYIDSEWTEFENIMAQSLDPAARRRRIIPVLLKPCEIPQRLKILNYLDFTNSENVNFQFERLVKAIKPRI